MFGGGPIERSRSYNALLGNHRCVGLNLLAPPLKAQA